MGSARSARPRRGVPLGLVVAGIVLLQIAVIGAFSSVVFPRR